MYLRVPVKGPILIKFRFSRQIFIKVPNIIFYGNPSCGRRADACGRMDMTVMGIFRNYANASNKTALS